MSEKPSWTKWMVEAAASTARARAITERSSSRRDDRSSRAGRPFETGRRVKKVPTEKSTSRYIARRYNRVRMAVTRREAGAASPVDYETLAELRYQIRLFMRRREDAARAAGIEPQQYLLLLQLKGLEDRGPTTVGALAERLQIRHHSAVELVDRLVERDMVARRRDSIDRREVSVTLRPAGEAVLRKLALYSMEVLRTEGPELVQVLRRLMPGRARARREQRTARTGGGGTQRQRNSW